MLGSGKLSAVHVWPDLGKNYICVIGENPTLLEYLAKYFISKFQKYVRHVYVFSGICIFISYTDCVLRICSMMYFLVLFRILAPTTYIFFASAIPVISFGEQLERDTSKIVDFLGSFFISVFLRANSVV